MNMSANRLSLLKRIIFFMMGAVGWCVLCTSAQAQDFGTQGKTWPILEPDVLKVIQSRLIRLENNGYFQKLQRQYQKKVYEAYTHPKPIAGIGITHHLKTWIYNPTTVLDHNIVSPTGQTLGVAGTAYNPLSVMRLGETLCFINGTKSQLAFAKALIHKSHIPVKVILVAGSIIHAEQTLRQRVYFDERGALTHKLHIQSAPAVVKQVGQVLQVSEVPVCKG